MLTTFRRRLTLFLASLSCPSSALPAYPSGSYHIVLFTRKADVQPLIWGYKFTREIARRMPHFSGEPPALHPAFAPGGPASVVAHAEGPIAFDTPRIVYSEEDERALEAFIRANGALLLQICASLAYFVALIVPGCSVHDLPLGEPLYTVRGVVEIYDVYLHLCNRVLARHLRDEATRAGRRRRRETERVRRARAQSCRHVRRAGKCQREHVRDRTRHWGESRRYHRGGARNKDVVQPSAIVRSHVG